MVTFKKLCVTITLPICCLCLGGCPAGEVQEQIAETQASVSENLTELQTKIQTNTAIHDQTFWVSKKNAMPVAVPKRLPERLNQSVLVERPSACTFEELQILLQELTGVSVVLTPDAEAKLKGRFVFQVPGGTSGSNSYKSSEQTEDSNAPLPGVKRLKWDGLLEGLLDSIGGELGLSWRFQNNALQFYYLCTETFYLYAIPTQTTMSSVVNSGLNTAISGSTGGLVDSQGSSGQDSDSGQSNQTTSVSLTTNIAKDVASNVEAMLTPGIGRISSATSTGAITVTDTQETLNAIRTYIHNENKLLTKQVLLNIKVLSLTLKDSQQLGLDWKLVNQALAHSKIGMELGSSGAASSSAIEKGLVGNITILDGQFKDSALIIGALDSQAHVSVVTSPSVTTLNLQPVPLQIAQQKNYLAKVSSTQSSDSLVTTTVEPGSVTSGFNMNLLPFVLDKGQLILQYAINLSELESIEETQAGNDLKIQLPSINNRIFSQKVKLQSGQTLVLSGFENAKSSQEKDGSFSAKLWPFGGKRTVEKQREQIVILITPIILE